VSQLVGYSFSVDTLPDINFPAAFLVFASKHSTLLHSIQFRP
jgi:hypothetical protein